MTRRTTDVFVNELFQRTKKILSPTKPKFIILMIDDTWSLDKLELNDMVTKITEVIDVS